MSFVQQDDQSFNARSAGFRDFRRANNWLHESSYFYRPQQPAVTANLDLSLLHPTLAAWMEKHYPGGVYRHQKLMIESAINGQNVVSTTPTGSGKSLGFMVPSFQKILTNPNARVIAFYPLRALSQDQVDKWFTMSGELGLGSELIQRIDGSVPIGDRAKKLRQARILLATPDVIHAWFMSNLNTEEVRRFLADTQLKIIDEVHTYDGVFGTNAMYLFRRMDQIQSRLTKNYDPKIHRQYLGASGTLPDAPQNFRLLTDVEAVHIGADENGAPMQRQNVFHAQSMNTDLAEFLRDAVDINHQQTIVFVDSRAKVEEYTHRIREAITHRLRDDVNRAVIPYKSGLRPEDYDHLHRLINSREARIVVSTSALESGIDVDFTFGINIGLPLTKSALLQRMGRIGRRVESTFIVSTADRPNKLMGGHTLYDYVQNFPMETPTLYPFNTSLQLAAALCLRSETSRVMEDNKEAQKAYPINWPRGFKTAFERAGEPWKQFAPHERHVIPPFRQKTYPQKHLPLRSQPLEHFTLMESYGRGHNVPIGDVSAETALREYTPGAIIRHLGQKYRVNAWAQNDDGSDVILTPYNGQNSTRSGVMQTITTSLTEKKIFKEQIRALPDVNLVDNGFLGHMAIRAKLNTTHFLEYAKKDGGGGYAFVRPYRYYDDHELATATKFAADNNIDYGPKRHITYDTFGIVIYIPERWFGRFAREDLGDKIVRAYCEKNSISPSDIGCNHQHVTVYWGEGNRIDTNVLAIYERGGNHIGLLEKLPNQLRQILLSIASEAKLDAKTGGEEERHSAKYTLGLVENMLRFVTALAPIKPDVLAKTIEEDNAADANIVMPEGYAAVLEPYTIAKYARTRTVQETLKILCPALNPSDKTVGYWVQSIDRKKFYDTSAKWITVKKEDVGKVVTEQVAGVMRRWQRPDVLNRFVSATYVMTESKRPALAINLETGLLSKVKVDPETKEVHLSEYTLPDETIRSLLTRSLPKRTPGLAVKTA